MGNYKVPGERVLGSYALDDVKEYMPVYLPSSSEVYYICFNLFSNSRPLIWYFGNNYIYIYIYRIEEGRFWYKIEI